MTSTNTIIATLMGFVAQALAQSATDCSQYTSCGGCVGNSGCGWCDAIPDGESFGKCLVANDVGNLASYTNSNQETFDCSGSDTYWLTCSVSQMWFWVIIAICGAVLLSLITACCCYCARRRSLNNYSRWKTHEDKQYADESAMRRSEYNERNAEREERSAAIREKYQL
eukprot:Clim_evm146s157 gene=Clim_evmTU146s157